MREKYCWLVAEKPITLNLSDAATLEREIPELPLGPFYRIIIFYSPHPLNAFPLVHPAPASPAKLSSPPHQLVSHRNPKTLAFNPTLPWRGAEAKRSQPYRKSPWIESIPKAWVQTLACNSWPLRRRRMWR
jgi:hypothetical protein